MKTDHTFRGIMQKQTLLIVVFLCSLVYSAYGLHKNRVALRSKLARLLKVLESREDKGQRQEKRYNDQYDSYYEEFHLPDGTYWGGDEWMELEDDSSNGHARDIIDVPDIALGSTAMDLIAGFEVYYEGEETYRTPAINYSMLPVQLAQNKDHHKYGPARRNFHLRAVLWTGGVIPYVIDTARISGTHEQEQIRKGIKDMNDLTCLKIIPKDQATSVPHNHVIRFTDDGGGCWSYVGMVHTLQDIGLSPGCYDKSTVIHEIMHAIGMEHEHQRTDRDKYIQMMWDNIENGKANNNMGQEQTDTKNSFDVESVLQYGLYSFAKDSSKKSMRIKDRQLEFLPDTASGLTFYDVEDITDGYGCVKKECTGKTLPSCINEGFVGHKCKCVCPSGLKGTRCELVDSGCGKVINLKEGESAEITSPNYPNPYTPGENCVWLIRGPDASNIHLNIVEMKLPKNEPLVRCYHWLEVRYNLLGQTGIKRCGTLSGVTHKTSNAAINGKGNLMMLKFNSKFSKDQPADKGFKLRVSAISGGVTPAPNPCLNTPCKNNGVCTSTGSSFTCVCVNGWTGPTCTDKSTPAPQPCDSSPCKNNGVCSNSGSSFNCACVNGWTGPTCSVAPSGKDIGKCTFESTDSSCFLLPGYKVTQASQSTIPTTAHSASHYVTVQPEGYVSLFLDSQKVNLTDGAEYCIGCYYYLKNEAVLNLYKSDFYDSVLDSRNGSISNGQWTPWTYTFIASSQLPVLDLEDYGSPPTSAIDDVTLSKGKCGTPAPDPCFSTPCKNNGICTNTGSSFTCTCVNGWAGFTCTDKSTPAPQPCDSSPCNNSGVCSNIGSSFTCACANGWSGPTCSVPPSRKDIGKCSFESTDSTCFLEPGYKVTQASPSTIPSTAHSASNYVTVQPEGYVSLFLDSQKVNLTDGAEYCFGCYYYLKNEAVLNLYKNDFYDSVLDSRNGSISNGQWTPWTYTFIASSQLPILDLEDYGSPTTSAIDDVILSEGKCP